MIPASEVYLHEPSALSGLLPGESAEHPHYSRAIQMLLFQEGCSDLSLVSARSLRASRP